MIPCVSQLKACQDAGAQKDMAFEKMCCGWALGSREFKKELLRSEGLLKDGDFGALRMEGRDMAVSGILKVA